MNRTQLIERLESRRLYDAAAMGDANGDGHVDVFDFMIVAQHFNATTNAGALQGDFNLDHHVNAIDFNILATNFGANMATSIDAGPFQIGGFITGSINAADFPNGTPQLFFTDSFGASNFDIVVNGTRWSVAVSAGISTGLKTEVQLFNGTDAPFALNDFSIVAGGDAMRNLRFPNRTLFSTRQRI